MASRALLGKLGAGKSRILADILIQEVIYNKRCIIGNFPVELDPWVNGVGKPQMGLCAYLLHVLKNEKLAQDARDRIFKLPDDLMPEFFLYRPIPIEMELPAGHELIAKTAKWQLVKAPGVYKGKEDKQKLVSFDTSLFGKSGGVCYLVDEAWKFWPSREWDTTAKAVLYYVAHSRKTGDDFWWATHNTKDIDAAVVRKTQEFHLVRNRGKLRVGVFRQPDDIKVEVFTDPPTGSAQLPMRTYKVLVDAQGRAQTYDTTGGVGLVGRMQGDMNEKKHGIPFRVLYIAMPLIGLLLWAMIALPLRAYAHKKQAEMKQVMNGTNQSMSTSIANGFIKMGQDSTADYRKGYTVDEIPVKPVVCVGYCFIARQPWVYLSNGKTYRPPSVEKVTPDMVTINGSNYDVEQREPVYVESKIVPTFDSDIKNNLRKKDNFLESYDIVTDSHGVDSNSKQNQD